MKIPKKTTGFLRKVLQLIVPLAILGGGVLGARALIASRPTVPKAAQEATPTMVEVITVQPQQERAVITAFGTVQAHRELTVRPQVGGRVVEQHAHLISGGLLRQGEVLLRIDPRDYQFAVESERGTLAKAEFELHVEQGNQVVAQREWNLLESSIETSELGKVLALRKPHLQEKQAAVAAANSRLAKAELDLQRTVLTAPFNALVLDESVEVGQLINAQSPVATLVSTDEFRIEVSIPIHQLSWVAIPGPHHPQGSKVRVVRDLGSGETIEREGWVERLLGEVTENGRMAQLLVLVHDPLGREQEQENRFPLLLGEYVRVKIAGPLLPDVFVLPRNSLREGGRVWVKNTENQLEVREVGVILSREDSILVRTGLNAGDQVIISPLPVALPGMLLQSADDPVVSAMTTPAAVSPAHTNGSDALLEPREVAFPITSEANVNAQDVDEDVPFQPVVSADHNQLTALPEQPLNTAPERTGSGANGSDASALRPSLPPELPPTASQSLSTSRPGATHFRVQLASVHERSLAREEGQRLQRRYADILGSMPLRVENAQLKNGRSVSRVQVGPLDKATAQSLCRSLKQHGQDCLVVKSVSGNRDGDGSSSPL